MEIIIFGIILFILGIGATYLYDHVKDQKTKRAALEAARPSRPVGTIRSTSKKLKTNYYQDIDEELYSKYKDHIQKALKNDMKQVMKDLAQSAQDANINIEINKRKNQSASVKELIKQIETLKKKK